MRQLGEHIRGNSDGARFHSHQMFYYIERITVIRNNQRAPHFGFVYRVLHKLAPSFWTAKSNEHRTRKRPKFHFFFVETMFSLPKGPPHASPTIWPTVNKTHHSIDTSYLRHDIAEKCKQKYFHLNAKYLFCFDRSQLRNFKAKSIEHSIRIGLHRSYFECLIKFLILIRLKPNAL